MPPPWPAIPQVAACMQSLNSLTYEQGERRFNDYYGKALTIYDYQQERGEIYSESLEKLHELSYLVVLSRVGKKMDQEGLHKLHAFGVIKHHKALLGIMPMKGGKSTHFLELLRDPEVQILSDDTPLISRWGRVLPFPLRVGLEQQGHRGQVVEQNSASLYHLHRERYGKKHLLSLRSLPHAVGGEYREIILFQGVRFNGNECWVTKMSWGAMAWELFRSLVVGQGLPMVWEYFWQFGPRDFVRKAGIILSRLLAACCLLWRARCYRVFLGRDIAKNTQVISEKFLDKG